MTRPRDASAAPSLSREPDLPPWEPDPLELPLVLPVPTRTPTWGDEPRDQESTHRVIVIELA